MSHVPVVCRLWLWTEKREGLAVAADHDPTWDDELPIENAELSGTSDAEASAVVSSWGFSRADVLVAAGYCPDSSCTDARRAAVDAIAGLTDLELHHVMKVAAPSDRREVVKLLNLPTAVLPAQARMAHVRSRFAGLDQDAQVRAAERLARTSAARLADLLLREWQRPVPTDLEVAHSGSFFRILAEATETFVAEAGEGMARLGLFGLSRRWPELAGHLLMVAGAIGTNDVHAHELGVPDYRRLHEMIAVGERFVARHQPAVAEIGTALWDGRYPTTQEVAEAWRLSLLTVAEPVATLGAVINRMAEDRGEPALPAYATVAEVQAKLSELEEHDDHQPRVVGRDIWLHSGREEQWRRNRGRSTG